METSNKDINQDNELMYPSEYYLVGSICTPNIQMDYHIYNDRIISALTNYDVSVGTPINCPALGEFYNARRAIYILYKYGFIKIPKIIFIDSLSFDNINTITTDLNDILNMFNDNAVALYIDANISIRLTEKLSDIGFDLIKNDGRASLFIKNMDIIES